MRKFFTIFVFCGISMSAAQAQFQKQFLPSPGFTDSLNTIVRDFKYNFQNVQGAPINLLEDVNIYAAKNSLPGAIRSYVYRYHSVDDTTASFHAIMYEGDDFDKASKVYKNNFHLLQKTRLKMEAFSTGFSGKMKTPDESTGFTISQLHATSNSAAYTDFIAEVEINYENMEWKVRLNFQKKRPDNVF